MAFGPSLTDHLAMKPSLRHIESILFTSSLPNIYHNDNNLPHLTSNHLFWQTLRVRMSFLHVDYSTSAFYASSNQANNTGRHTYKSHVLTAIKIVQENENVLRSGGNKLGKTHT